MLPDISDNNDDIINIVKQLEFEDLMKNRHSRDFFKPQPIVLNKIKIAFIDTMTEYLNSDFNITSMRPNLRGFKRMCSKYPIAIQIYYPYNGNDSTKFKKEVVSLWVVDCQGEVTNLKRIW